jgi:predicted metalloprotease
MADWGKISSRGDVEDRRRFAPVAGGVSLVGVILVIAFNYFTGGNLGDVLYQLNSYPQDTQQQKVTSQYDGQDTYETFASAVLGSNNDAWSAIFTKINRTYTPPKLVLFRQATDSACGGADSRVGPHYCPSDNTIYLDETFFDELTNRFGAKGGDVAQAYVISHEVGHYIQNLNGNIDTVQTNEDSVRLELQADCYAGIWAHFLKDKNIFEPGEINEAMNAAGAVGDDHIQQTVQGYVNPETFTHGTSAQRVQWFTEGYTSGDMAMCDTSR